MHSCKSCLSFNMPCHMNCNFLKCEECYQKNQKCNLILNYKKMNKAIAEFKKLDAKILETRQKLTQQKKQQKF